MPPDASRRRIRVLHVTGSWPPFGGGVSDYLHNLHVAMGASGGYQGEVVTTAMPERTPEQRADVVVEVQAWGPRDVWRVARFARRSNHDVIHVQMPSEPYGKAVSPGLLPILLRAMGCRKPIVVTVHEFKRRSRLGKLRTTLTCVPAQRVVTIDDCNRDIFPRGIRAKTEVVLVGPNLAIRDPPPVERAGGATTFGYFGAVRATKGLEGLLRAYAIARRTDPGIQLVVVGIVDRAFKDAVVDPLMRDLGVDAAVKFTGGIDEDKLQATLLEIDVGVLPFPDGLSGGRTSFVALAALGIPIVTSPPCCATMRDLRHAGVTYAPSEDYAAFAREMIAFSREESRLREARTAAFAAKDQFSWRDISERHLRVYEECVDRERRKTPGRDAEPRQRRRDG